MTQTPVYRVDLGQVFPEVVKRTQSTQECPRPVAAMSMVCAFVHAGQWFEGTSGPATPDDFIEEISLFCGLRGLDPDRLLRWAQSLLIPPEDTIDRELLRHVPREMIGPGFSLHGYQSETAAWAAHRMGSILALGCGVGKTATSVAAAAAAAATGKCSDHRCFVICPVNAMGTWDAYLPDLRRYFRDVSVVSCDSLHHYARMDGDAGGALIVDEAHKLKNVGRYRTDYAHDMRQSFEWATCLTGSLLHTGAESVLSLLDLACPGLSRFLDKWAYGETFNCIVMQQAGRAKRRKLVLVPSSHHAVFTDYLKRGVRSLDNESEIVKGTINVPDQLMLIEDSWLLPDWAQAAMSAKVGELYGHTLYQAPDGTPAILNPSVLPWKEYLGAYAVALMNQRRLEIVAEMTEAGLDVSDPPTTLMTLLQQFPKDGVYRRMARQWELPTLLVAVQDCLRDGRIDRILAKVKRTTPAGKTKLDFRFIYHDDDWVNPKPGPKIQYLRSLLDSLEDDEPIVIGAAGVKTLDMVELLLREKGIDYRLIRGSVGKDDRADFVRGFQAGEFRVMLLQQVAGSESVNLTRGAVSVLVDRDASPLVYTQFKARTCRQGQTRECLHIDLSYHALQMEDIRRLRRGEDFDSTIRKRIEAEVDYDKIFEGGAANEEQGQELFGDFGDVGGGTGA